MKDSSLIVILVAIFAVSLPIDDYSQILVFATSSLAMVLGIAFLSNKDSNIHIRNIFLRPSFLFILAYLIVFFQRPLDYALGYSFNYTQLGDVRFMAQSLKYALLGLCMFIIGYMYESKRVNVTSAAPLKIKIVSLNFYAFLSSLFIALVFILVPKEILMGGYSNDLLTNATIYNYLASWSNTIMICYVAQYTLNAKQTGAYLDSTPLQFIKSFGIWQNVNFLTYCYMILNVGDRGPLIVLAFAYYISYIVVSHRKLSKVKLIIALCAGILMSSILGDTKQYRNNNTIFDRLSSVFENKGTELQTSFLPATEQLSGSYCCLPLAIQMISSKDEYTYGGSTIGDLSAGIPFSGRILELPESTSYRISKYALGDSFSFGLGTNCIAALYMDGGIIFICLGMLLFGILLRKFEVCIFIDTTKSLFIFCMAFYFLTRVIYIPRSTLMSPFKYALWMYVLMALYIKFGPAIKKR